MIDPITGAGITEALAGINSGLTGMSLQDAYDDRITGQFPTDDGPTIGFADYTTNSPAISGNTSGTISDGTSGATPVDAWNDYVENNPTKPVSEVTGGIVSGSKVGTFAYSLMEDSSGGAAVVKAVAAVAIPIDAAIVAVGQALGVSIDVNNLASETKEAFVNSFTSVPGAVYDKAKGLVTAWKDELGRVLFPKKVVDALYETFQDIGIGPSEESASSDLIPYHVPVVSGYRIEYHRATNPSQQYWYAMDATGCTMGLFNTANGEGLIAICASATSGITLTEASNQGTYPMNLSNSYTYNGQTVYWNTKTRGGAAAFPTDFVTTTEPAPSTIASDYAQIAWTLIYGTISGGGGYPEGTSESEATKYNPSTIPIAGDLATSYNEETGDLDTEPLVPIHLTEDPYDATGDTTDPIDPTDEDNTGVVNPPLPLPIPDTKPSNPDVPLVNPSIVDYELINELIEELADTLDPQAPQSSGLIPVPPLPGIFDPSTGETTFPSIIPQSGPGFIHVYNPTPAEFVAFGTWLWVTYADATIDKILNNPFDGVIGAHELYATPNRDGSDNIRSAFLTCPTTAALVTNRYSEIDCGTVIVPEFYGNYLDYAPYSQAYIYLPFIGINEVSIDDIVGHAVNIRYRVDSYSGSCIAMIFVAKNGYQNLCYQFAGSCSVEVPMAGGSQAAIKAGMMQAEAYARAAMIQAGANAVGGIGSALMGNVGGVLSSLSGIASNYAQAQAGVEAAKVANKSSVQHSGQFGASHGAMGEKVPFIIIRNPIQVKVVNYNEDYGFPAHKRVIVGGCRGYLRVREVNVISAHATDEEKMAIEMALKGGVYVS